MTSPYDFSLIKKIFSFRLIVMGYVFDFKDAIAYELWLDKPQNKGVIDFENKLMIDMLKPRHGTTFLDIGCGTGVTLLALLEKGVDITGIDPSPYMLDRATKHLGNRADLHRGHGEDLPFDDNTFNYTSLITSLEFSNNPKKILEEACRVTKEKLFLGVINKYAFRSIYLRVKGIPTRTIYNHARFFSIWELKRMIKGIMGQDVPIHWQTICLFPPHFEKITNKNIRPFLIPKYPFGAFIGVMVTLVPRYTTKPLSISYHQKLGARS